LADGGDAAAEPHVAAAGRGPRALEGRVDAIGASGPVEPLGISWLLRTKRSRSANRWDEQNAEAAPVGGLNAVAL